MVQHEVGRLIVSLKKRDHITPTLIQLHWLLVENPIIFNVFLLVYKSLHSNGPDYPYVLQKINSMCQTVIILTQTREPLELVVHQNGINFQRRPNHAPALTVLSMP